MRAPLRRIRSPIGAHPRAKSKCPNPSLWTPSSNSDDSLRGNRTARHRVNESVTNGPASEFGKESGHRRTGDPAKPKTLAIDVGGSGIKAAVLDAAGGMVSDRVRIRTNYPCPPEALVGSIRTLVEPLPRFDRVSVGFPGMVREGRTLSASHFETVAGPGSKVSEKLKLAWSGFDLAGALEAELAKPVRAANDADMQGAAVIEGTGLELVITLGTGVGTALFYNGRLMPHLELAHHPFRKGETYNEQLGDAARRRVGARKWTRRVERAVHTLDALIFFDRLYVGGGNAPHLTKSLGPKAVVVDNVAGILGGAKLWSCL